MLSHADPEPDSNTATPPLDRVPRRRLSPFAVVLVGFALLWGVACPLWRIPIGDQRFIQVGDPWPETRDRLRRVGADPVVSSIQFGNVVPMANGEEDWTAIVPMRRGPTFQLPDQTTVEVLVVSMRPFNEPPRAPTAELGDDWTVERIKLGPRFRGGTPKMWSMNNLPTTRVDRLDLRRHALNPWRLAIAMLGLIALAAWWWSARRRPRHT